MMNRRFFQTRRVPFPSSMEIELARRDLPRENNQSPRVRTPMPNFRINRIRRPVIPKPTELTEAVSHHIDHIPCRYCHNLIICNQYDSHIAHCPMKAEILQENRGDIVAIDIDGSQRQEEDPTIESIVVDDDTSTPIIEEPSHVQPINSIPNNSRTYLSEELLEDIPNFAEDLESPTMLPMRPDPQDIHAFHPPSIFSSVLSGISEHLQENVSTENHPNFPSVIEDNSLPNTSISQDDNAPQDQTDQPDQPETDAPRQPHGAFVVRTIESGPNGSTIVRMRVIPLDSIFGRQEGNENEANEGNEYTEANEQPGILGLLRMLAALQGVRAAHFGDFLSLFHEERGLEKEVLDSLPVVTYTEEGFKNVDEESKRCTICLDHYEEQHEVKFLWCMHRFHKNCVDQWLDKHTNCPFCKKDYSEAIRNFE